MGGNKWNQGYLWCFIGGIAESEREGKRYKLLRPGSKTILKYSMLRVLFQCERLSLLYLLQINTMPVIIEGKAMDIHASW